MAWNYRVVRYQANGETLYGLMEIYYDADGQQNGCARASVLHWTSPLELRGTLDLMQRALAQPVIELPGDITDPIVHEPVDAE